MGPTFVIIHVSNIVRAVDLVLFNHGRAAFVWSHIEFNFDKAVAVVNIGGLVEGFTVFSEHGEGDAGLSIDIVHDHRRLHDHIIRVSRSFNGDNSGHGAGHGAFSVFKGETRGIVNFSSFVVVEGGSVCASAFALRFVWVFGSEVVVVGHAITIDVIIKGIARSIAVHVSGNAGSVEGVRTTLVFNTVCV